MFKVRVRYCLDPGLKSGMWHLYTILHGAWVGQSVFPLKQQPLFILLCACVAYLSYCGQMEMSVNVSQDNDNLVVKGLVMLNTCCFCAQTNSINPSNRVLSPWLCTLKHVFRKWCPREKNHALSSQRSFIKTIFPKYLKY